MRYSQAAEVFTLTVRRNLGFPLFSAKDMEIAVRTIYIFDIGLSTRNADVHGSSNITSRLMIYS